MPPTLLDLRTRAYARVDEGQQNYVLVPEMNSLINEAAAHLHNWLINEGEYYIWNETTIPLVPGQSDYNLPADFMKVLKVFGPAISPQVNGPAALRPLPRMMPQEYAGLGMGGWQGPSPQWPQAYMLMGNKLRIMPVPAVNSGIITLWYAPMFVPLVADTDTINMVMEPGWEEFIVNQVAIAFRIKEESDTTPLVARQKDIMAMIQQSMSNRDMGQHARVVDTEASIQRVTW